MIIAHKVFFSLWTQQDFDWPKDAIFREAVLADVVFYATFYGLFDKIAHNIGVQNVAVFPEWTDIAKNPEFYLGMSQVLRDEDMWYEALRQMVGDYFFPRPEDLFLLPP